MANQVDPEKKTAKGPQDDYELSNNELSLQTGPSMNGKTPIDDNPYDSPKEDPGEKTALAINFNDADLTNDCYEEPIMFPQSTHSLLFTEPVCSIPFLFAVFIVVLSLISLSLAMTVNNIVFQLILQQCQCSSQIFLLWFNLGQLK